MAEYRIYLLTEQMQKHIKSVIDSIFIKMVNGHKQFITKFTILLVDTIGCKLNFTRANVDDFFTQISQNDSRDIISIMYLMLPYMDDANNYHLLKQIVRLEDITCKKKSSSVYSNNYVISNYQFSRYVDINTDEEYLSQMLRYGRITNQNGYYEYKYSIIDLEISFKLVLKTIDQIISRLYVNWINIIPITLSDYRESSKYKQTFYWDDSQRKFMCLSAFNNIAYPFDFWNLDLDSDLRSYGGMGAEDVFNTIYVFLFKEIYNSGVKWLLYEKQDTTDTQPTMYIELLDQILSIDNFYFNKIYDTIDSKKRKLSEETWRKIINQVILDPNSKYANFLKLVVLKFDLKYCDKELAKEYKYDYTSLYKELNIKKANFIDDDDYLETDESYNAYDLRKLNPGAELYSKYIEKLVQFELIPFEVIYEFLVEQIQRFKLTWYGKRIFKQTDNNIIIDKEVKFNQGDNHIIIGKTKYFPTYKNIYNFAKSIAIKLTESSNKSNIIDARSLSPEQKTIFMSILNRQVGTNFNITQVLKKTYGLNLSIQTIRQLQNFIADYFMVNLKDLVFTTWIQLGLLNKFVTDPSITDEKLLGDSETSRKENIKKKLEKKFSDEKIKSNLLNSYYYLTLDKYSNLEIYSSKTDKQIDWFELTFKENEPWYYSFAMNWVSQINFLHHFISNRVMFVTGATGQGKSTEVPKLLYYALKAVNLNLTGRVVSTQPTIIPTIKNAKIIAKNLGVPIDINGFNTSSPYLQYSTQDKKHLISGSQTYIKEVTDRTLFEEIIQSPFLKRMKGKEKKEFTNENLYDIVIIDEAHMHNINMDLILTFMRNVVNINNQIKLIITSATMNDDEFIYRRYYKILDDNYGYPICPTIARLEFSPNYVNGVDEDYYLLDKITVDRRYHISPPGLTTKYKVTDKYLEIDTSNYDEAEAEGLKILTDIMAKNSTGDVLFFTTTEPAINSLIKRINETSPTHVIALPLYGALKNKPGDWFDKIENIDKNLKSFTYSKTQLLDIIDGIIPNPAKVSPGTYTMAVIVATNIVEASVTIPTLRFVIDTGYFNSVVFDDEIDDQSISIDPIPEASRLQRRGRVGRVAPGTVYYTYAKDARAHIKPRYGIVTADVTYDLFKIMYTDTSKNINPIYDINSHPIKWNIAKKDSPTLEWKEYINSETNPDIKKLYLNQYMPLEVNSIVNPFDNTVIDIKAPYSDGYTIRELMDTQGSFYIIHPDEYKIRRNVITGKISNIDIYVRRAEYNSPKLIKSLERLAAIKYIYAEKEIRNFQTDYMYFKKLPYNTIIDDILRDENNSIGFLLKNFKEDDVIKIFKTILVAHCYNCVDSTIKILSMIYSIGSYKNFVAKQKSNPKFNDYDNFISMWEDPQSELFSFLKIMNFFVQLKQSNEKDSKKISKSVFENSFLTFGDLLKKYGNKVFLKKTIKELETKSIDKSDIVNFMYYTNNNYNSKKRYEDYSKQKTSKNKKQSVSNYSEYCNKFYINLNGILSALRMYSTLTEIFQKDNHREKINDFVASYPVIKSLDHKENILKCFLEGYLGNLCVYTADRKIMNLLTEVQVKPPKLALTNLFESPIFFCLKGRDELFGLTKISRELVEQVFPINIITSNQKFIDEEPSNISNISLKYLYNKPNSKMINVYINNQMQKIKVKRYRLRVKI